MLSLAALSLLPLALRPSRRPQEPRGPAHACQGQMRVRTITEDGREGYGCPCLTGPHRVLVPEVQVYGE